MRRQRLDVLMIAAHHVARRRATVLRGHRSESVGCDEDALQRRVRLAAQLVTGATAGFLRRGWGARTNAKSVPIEQKGFSVHSCPLVMRRISLFF